MKLRTQIILIGTLLLLVAALSSLKRDARSDDSGRERGACCPILNVPAARLAAAATNETPVAPPFRQVIAYYFHGTVRCDTCRLMELLAKNVIEQQFRLEMDAQRLVFLPVNYDLPENAHYRTNYGLPPPALVLVRQQDDQTNDWRLLGETWALIQDPPRFNSYVETQVRHFLNSEAPAAADLNAERPSALATH